MLKRICDFCGVEINVHIPNLDRDSQTHHYPLISDRGTPIETECDICNKCLKKIIGGAE